MIKLSSSGIYSWLPLGLKVLKKIENIVRDEQEAAETFRFPNPKVFRRSKKSILTEDCLQIFQF